MKQTVFYLAAIMLHLLVLYAMKAPALQTAPAAVSQKYVEVTLDDSSLRNPASPLPPVEQSTNSSANSDANAMSTPATNSNIQMASSGTTPADQIKSNLTLPRLADASIGQWMPTEGTPAAPSTPVEENPASPAGPAESAPNATVPYPGAIDPGGFSNGNPHGTPGFGPGGGISSGGNTPGSGGARGVGIPGGGGAGRGVGGTGGPRGGGGTGKGAAPPPRFAPGPGVPTQRPPPRPRTPAPPRVGTREIARFTPSYFAPITTKPPPPPKPVGGPVAMMPANPPEPAHYFQAFVITNGISWSKAQVFASGHDGYLAIITSAAVNDFVFQLVMEPKYWRNIVGSFDTDSIGPWLGGIQAAGSATAQTGWYWGNGAAFRYANWSSEHLDRVSDGEYHLHFFGNGRSTPQATWGSLPGNAMAEGFVVEYDDDPQARTRRPSRAGSDAENNTAN